MVRIHRHGGTRSHRHTTGRTTRLPYERRQGGVGIVVRVHRSGTAGNREPHRRGHYGRRGLPRRKRQRQRRRQGGEHQGAGEEEAARPHARVTIGAVDGLIRHVEVVSGKRRGQGDTPAVDVGSAPAHCRGWQWGMGRERQAKALEPTT